jgi:hypothetical protein
VHRVVVGIEIGGIDAGQRHGDRLAQREFGFETAGRVFDVADLVGAGVDPKQDPLHLLGRKIAFQPDFLGAFDRRMRQITGGVDT